MAFLRKLAAPRVQGSVQRRADFARATRGVDVAYEAHYEDFQLAPGEQAARLLRAVGVLGTEIGEGAITRTTGASMEGERGRGTRSSPKFSSAAVAPPLPRLRLRATAAAPRCSGAGAHSYFTRAAQLPTHQQQALRALRELAA